MICKIYTCINQDCVADLEGLNGNLTRVALRPWRIYKKDTRLVVPESEKKSASGWPEIIEGERKQGMKERGRKKARVRERE